jgi:DNA/RNA-binding domain of Phe-tRNA-synthetase-like protein
MSEPPVRRGEVAPEVAEELPGLWLAWTAFEAADAPSPPEVRERLRALSDSFRGAQAIALRRREIPHLYRVLFRHIGLDPDEHHTPVEALALERLKRGGFPSRGLVGDALTIATMDTGVPVWAFDADRLEGGLGLRQTADGRLVIADDRGPVAVLFGEPEAGRAVGRATRRLALVSVAAPGVPHISVEEALWTAWDIVVAE